MKSPSRPKAPLRDRSNRNMILKDQSYLKQKEVNERRQIRVKQARERANEVVSAPNIVLLGICVLLEAFLMSFRNVVCGVAWDAA